MPFNLDKKKRIPFGSKSTNLVPKLRSQPSFPFLKLTKPAEQPAPQQHNATGKPSFQWGVDYFNHKPPASLSKGGIASKLTAQGHPRKSDIAAGDALLQQVATTTENHNAKLKLDYRNVKTQTCSSSKHDTQKKRRHSTRNPTPFKPAERKVPPQPSMAKQVITEDDFFNGNSIYKGTNPFSQSHLPLQRGHLDPEDRAPFEEDYELTNKPLVRNLFQSTCKKERSIRSLDDSYSDPPTDLELFQTPARRSKNRVRPWTTTAKGQKQTAVMWRPALEEDSYISSFSDSPLTPPTVFTRPRLPHQLPPTNFTAQKPSFGKDTYKETNQPRASQSRQKNGTPYPRPDSRKVCVNTESSKIRGGSAHCTKITESSDSTAGNDISPAPSFPSPEARDISWGNGNPPANGYKPMEFSSQLESFCPLTAHTTHVPSIVFSRTLPMSVTSKLHPTTAKTETLTITIPALFTQGSKGSSRPPRVEVCGDGSGVNITLWNAEYHEAVRNEVDCCVTYSVPLGKEWDVKRWTWGRVKSGDGWSYVLRFEKKKEGKRSWSEVEHNEDEEEEEESFDERDSGRKRLRSRFGRGTDQGPVQQCHDVDQLSEQEYVKDYVEQKTEKWQSAGVACRIEDSEAEDSDQEGNEDGEYDYGDEDGQDDRADYVTDEEAVAFEDEPREVGNLDGFLARYYQNKHGEDESGA